MREDPSNDAPRSKLPGWIWCSLLAVVLAHIIITVTTLLWVPSASLADLGNVSQAVAALFSGLAFAGLLIALWLQREELSLQREELRLTREELHSQSVSQAALVKAQLQAAEISARGALLQASVPQSGVTQSSPGAYFEAMKESATRKAELIRCLNQVAPGSTAAASTQ